MDPNKTLNMTMLCDFYELTMGNGYLDHNMQDRITYFDVFFRSVPDDGGYAIAAGLEQIIDYIQNLHFTDEDIAYLRGRKLFSEAFLDYLKNFRFTGDIWAVPEGTPIFPKEPIITVRAPAIEAQLIETFLLLSINHQSLIATKANRVVRAAEGRTVLEFGSRRAQGADAAILGARAAYIGGCNGTACTISDQLYGVYAGGTMAHAWVQMFDSEYEAFKAYCEIYPTNAVLLVDTYNTLHSGVPNAIKAFNEVLKPMGITKCGIRLDSGDMAYLTQQARKMLDEAGWTDYDENGVRTTVRADTGKLARMHLRFYVYEEQENSVRVEVANRIADALMQVGIECKVETLTYKEARDKLKAGSYDLCLAAFNIDFTPDPGYLLISGNNCNYMRYKSTEMDNLFKTLRAAQEESAYRAALQSIQTLFWNDCPFVCLYYRNGSVLTRKMFTNARDVREPEVLRGIETFKK